MAVSVQCPGCFSTLQIAPEKLGSKVKCRTCAKVFVAQTESSQEATGRRGGGKDKSPPSRSKKSKKGASSSPVGLIAGAAVALVLAVGAYIFFSSRGRAPQADPATPQPDPAVLAGVPSPNPSPPGAPPAPGAVWKVVDPPREPLEWTRGLDVQIALPKEDLKRVFPTLPSPFLASGSDAGFTVFDFRTSQPAKKFQFPAPRAYTKAAVSPDGLHMATIGHDHPKREPGAPANRNPVRPPSKIQIVSIAAGTVTAEIDLPAGISSAQWIAFRSPTELVVVGIVKDMGRTGVVLGLDGKVLRPLPVPRSIASNVIHLSPGGRYLLVIETFVQPANPLVAIDLETGQSLGRANTADEVYRSVHLTDLAFSPDGRQIGILQRYDDAFRVLVLNSEDGKTIRQVTVPGDSTTILSKRVGGDKGIAWHPGGKHLVLFDGLVIDAESGAIAVDLGNARESRVDVDILGHLLLKTDWIETKTIRSTSIELPSAT